MIRESKTLVGPFPSFHVNELPDYPHELFLEWFKAAVDKGVHEPHAMTLSTTDPNGSPDARVLIMKDVDQHGWYFASSSQSEKGKQISGNPNVALTFYWSLIGRQVRIRGTIVEMDKDINAKDFLKRGTIARAITLLGKQSSILHDQRELEEALTNEIEKIKQDLPIIYPDWTLYRVNPLEVEFWQADEDRKHTRVKYTFVNGTWKKDLLWP
ncbi:pyridoxal 5'-phosphate synthase [Sporosarcina sp. ACRSL]|nr:pyridoxal 5'-phosphate synthase [Sporosarcina sp. ACRSL]MCG7344681.1 pyridoxal 5'-phosphate synthase [Sporosarcina sp. ACRSL]